MLAIFHCWQTVEVAVDRLYMRVIGLQKAGVPSLMNQAGSALRHRMWWLLLRMLSNRLSSADNQACKILATYWNTLHRRAYLRTCDEERCNLHQWRWMHSGCWAFRHWCLLRLESLAFTWSAARPPPTYLWLPVCHHLGCTAVSCCGSESSCRFAWPVRWLAPRDLFLA